MNDFVKEFKESISYKHGHYYVKLPWRKDLVKQFPSTFKIALAVGQRVYDRPGKKDIVYK